MRRPSWAPRSLDFGLMTDQRMAPTRISDPVRQRRLREDARRSMSTNLAEGIALSHALMRFVGAAPRVSDPAFDELLRRLAAAEVRFVLVGGLAVNAWGVVRGTKDVDVVVAPDEANLARLADLAAAVGGRVQVEEAFLSSTRAIAAQIATGARVQIETQLGSLDVVQGLTGVPSYEGLRARAREADTRTDDGLDVPGRGLQGLRHDANPVSPSRRPQPRVPGGKRAVELRHEQCCRQVEGVKRSQLVRSGELRSASRPGPDRFQ